MCGEAHVRSGGDWRTLLVPVDPFALKTIWALQDLWTEQVCSSGTSHTLPVALWGSWAWWYGNQALFSFVTQISFLILGNIWSWALEMQTELDFLLEVGRGRGGKYRIFNHQDIKQKGNKIIVYNVFFSFTNLLWNHQKFMPIFQTIVSVWWLIFILGD